MFSGIFRLVLISFIIIIVSILFDLLERRQKHLGTYNYWYQQIICGIVFGFLAILCTEFGIEINGAMMNVRSAAPLCAGLFFGSPAGLIAGLIGGIERWFASLWGVGVYTRLACTLGTIAAGLVAALLRKFIFENKKPSPLESLMVGVAVEVFHMLLVFLTNMNDILKAYDVIQRCSIVMVPMVSITVCVASYMIKCINHEKIILPKQRRNIIQDIRVGMLICVIFTLIITSVFFRVLQNNLAINNAEISIKQSVSDIRDGYLASEIDARDYLSDAIEHRHIGQYGYFVLLDGQGQVLHKTGETFNNVLEDADCQDLIPSLTKARVKSISRGENSYYVSYDTIEDYTLLAVYPEAETERTRNVSVYVSLFIQIILLGVLFIGVFLIVRNVVVDKLVKITEDLTEITEGKLDKTVKVNGNSEFISLSNDINKTVNKIKEFMREANQKLIQELEFAREIQLSSLPKVYPDMDEIDLYANMMPAKEVGGDFYDFYMLDSDHIVLLIADVSGKGIPAAMFMMRAKTLIKDLVENGFDPGEALTSANQELCQNNVSEMFITVWLGIVNINTGELQFANAGHNPPILARKSKTPEYFRTKAGFVVGGLPGIQYENQTVKLSHGDILFLYTDGVTEAINPKEELYGEDRLLSTLETARNYNMRYLCKYIKSSVDEYAENTDQYDDITMVAFRLEDKPEPANAHIRVKPDKDSLITVKEFFDHYAEANHLPKSTIAKLMVIVDDLYSNIVYYSGADLADIYCRKFDDKLLLSIKDNGTYYNMLEKEDPDITLAACDREIGGLGILIIKDMSEDIKYSRYDNKNVLDIVIKIQGE